MENGEDPESPLYKAIQSLLKDGSKDPPSYLITQYEIAMGDVIHESGFSTVRRGVWQNCEVAIKELPPETERAVSVRVSW